MAPQFTVVIWGIGLLGILGGAANSALAFAIAGKTKMLSSWQTIFLVTGLLHLTGVLVFNLTADATRQPWADVTLNVKPTNQKADSGRVRSVDESSFNTRYLDMTTKTSA